MRKNAAQPDKPQMRIRRMRIACCVTKATEQHSEYVILIALPRQQWLRERALMGVYRYIACLVTAYVRL